MRGQHEGDEITALQSFLESSLSKCIKYDPIFTGSHLRRRPHNTDADLTIQTLATAASSWILSVGHADCRLLVCQYIHRRVLFSAVPPTLRDCCEKPLGLSFLAYPCQKQTAKPLQAGKEDHWRLLLAKQSQ